MTKPQTATIFMRCGCSWAAKRHVLACQRYGGAWRCSTAEQYGVTCAHANSTLILHGCLAKSALFPGYARPTPIPPIHHHPRASSLDLLSQSKVNHTDDPHHLHCHCEHTLRVGTSRQCTRSTRENSFSLHSPQPYHFPSIYHTVVHAMGYPLSLSRR